MPNKSSTPPQKLALMLLGCAIMVFVMVVLGGVTRLTGSGLSIVEWRPITGTLPPLTTAAWLDLFRQYQTTPEYHHVNAGMTLAGFKQIFWMEYAHRLWGRFMGIALLVPTLYAIWKPSLRGWLKPLASVWLLGLAQGALGWYMVKSGLVKEPWVSPYRLTAHLCLALLILGVLLRTSFRLSNTPINEPNPLRTYTWILLACITLTIFLGGLVAGLKAGLIYNTFPDMNGQFIPEDAWFLTPSWRNFFENPAMVQFCHRLAALVTFALIMGLFLASRHQQVPQQEQKKILLLSFAGFLQVFLGISTLLLQVPVHLAVLHQAGAMVVFCLTIWVLHPAPFHRSAPK